MHRYNTRFQSRQAANKQPVQVQAPVQVQEPVQVQKKECPYHADIKFLKNLLQIHSTMPNLRSKIKNALEFFSYLAIHPGVIHVNREFRQAVRAKIADLRRSSEVHMEKSVNTFISYYQRNQSENTIRRLEDARSILADCKQLEVELKKVEIYLQ
jgi:hypothetical protein